ncbi:choice-of-anchor L domain-containing protein [Ancylomarina longa]|uniref:Calx-beta domain-containing protein n=1 Tax=Ancylomarina longa TaxID=2487017 RepID=A0A434AVS1_9BACT|nr:choice-of-anchor L domain-containing protein [Ancylomarina longa]RUT78476.1 hypothetical protein DLK05_07830 [Ancylomarina longa]
MTTSTYTPSSGFVLRFVLFLSILFCSVVSKAQTTIWSEDFTGNNGNVAEVGGWTTSGYVGAYWFKVQNEMLEIRDNNRNQATWTTDVIDITGYTSLAISIDVQESGTLEPAGNADEDFVRFEYRLDGGTWTQFYQKYDDFPRNNTFINASTTVANGTSLELRATFKNGQGNVEYYRIDNIEVTGDNGVVSPYCDSYGNVVYNTSVTQVDFNTISNSSGKSAAYSDNTSQTTDISIGYPYDLTVNVNTDGNYRIYARAWIDWNQDGDFSDTGEAFDLGNVKNTSNGATNACPYTITVPASATLGTTRMRVAAKYNAYPNECDVDFDGEVEDYSVNIIPHQPSVSLSALTSNINENGGSTSIAATMDVTYTQDVTVNLSVTGSAGSSDYTLSSTQIVVPAGSLSGSVTLTATDDALNEGDETVIFSISSLVNGMENGTQQQTVTIVDDDVPSTDPIQVDRQAPENGYTADELVQNVLVTGCLTASNVTYSGDESLGLGYFNASTSDFPLSSGIIMSTGKVSKAEGPNSSAGTSDNIGQVTGDSDVNYLTGNSANDAQILEFDFVPAGDVLNFNYIFASEEYYEYACGAYNDVFAFIISGPGITADTGLSGKNIALVPGSTNAVTINNVNDQGCGNPTYYVDETGGYATEFDGRTTTLTATANVQACQTYHIRLIISDVADASFNSAVFLEAKSFKSNEVVIQNGIGVQNDVDVMYEGCTGSYIKFNRTQDIDVNLTFDLNVGGTATNGVDYLYVDEFGNQIGDGKIPSTVTMPAGTSDVTYYYKALSDASIEGDETLKLSFLKSCPCSAPDYYEKTITIVDIPEIEASPTSLVSCLGATPVATITVNLKSGLDPADYQYSFDGGALQDNNVFTLNNPAVGSTYTVLVQDRYACKSATFDVVIPEVTPIAANAGPDKTMCEGDTPQLEGSGGIYYEWSCSPASGLTYLSDVNVSNPTVDANIPFGTYTFTLTVKESSSSSASCVDTDDMILTVQENSHFTISTDKPEYCSGEVISLQSTIANSNVGDTYLWTPSADVANSAASNTTATYNETVLSAKDFSLTITKANGCNNTENISGVLINPEPVVSLNTSSNLCSDGSNGEIDVDVTGGTPYGGSPFYDFSWSHDGTLNSPNAINLGVGGYSVTVSDSKSCTSSSSFTIDAKPNPVGIYHD